MTLILPLLNTTNSPVSFKRKLVHKAAPTCTLSLTNVSVSGSSDSFSFIPFPSAPASVPFPSAPISIPTSTSPTKPSSILPPRPRIRTQASPLLRKRRSLARLVQPPPPSSSSPVESEPERTSPTPPRKRARKANLSSSSSSSSSAPPPTTPACHSLAISQRKPKASRKTAADLRFMCTVYRSVARRRAQREFSGGLKGPDAMDVDIAQSICASSALDAQESLLASRLRSYLIFNDMNPQWLDVAPVPSDPFFAEVDMDVDTQMQQDSSPPVPSTAPFPPYLPIMTPEQVTASLLFRFRHRSKGKSRPEAAVGDNKVPVKAKKRSPLAGAEASWCLEDLVC